MSFVSVQLIRVLYQIIYMVDISSFESKLFVSICNFLSGHLASSTLERCVCFLFGEDLETQGRTDIASVV